jgi:hypothetical protein
MLENRYIRAKGLFDRVSDRPIALIDVVTVVRRASIVEPCVDSPCHGGTCWRVRGRDADDRPLAIGVELFYSDTRRCVSLNTVDVDARVD